MINAIGPLICDRHLVNQGGGWVLNGDETPTCLSFSMSR